MTIALSGSHCRRIDVDLGHSIRRNYDRGIAVGVNCPMRASAHSDPSANRDPLLMVCLLPGSHSLISWTVVVDKKGERAISQFNNHRISRGACPANVAYDINLRSAEILVISYGA